MGGPLAARWSRTVPALREHTLRVAYLRVELSGCPPSALAGALDELSGLAEQADPVAREVLAAALTVLAHPEAAGLVSTLHELADRGSLLPLGRLLRRRTLVADPPGRGTAERIPRPGDERTLATSSSGRVLTLGERRALARRPSRAAFDRLLRDPHPMVVQNLLQNPRLTEDDVVQMVARRPVYPEVIGEVARHPSWSQRARVRMAIVQNPSAPPEITVPLVRLLIRPELRQVLAATDVPALVRAAATELLERRPPVPQRGTRGEPQ